LGSGAHAWGSNICFAAHQVSVAFELLLLMVGNIKTNVVLIVNAKKHIIIKKLWRPWAVFLWFGIWISGGCCQHNNQSLDCVKDNEIID
jgi:hypothetical protein